MATQANLPIGLDSIEETLRDATPQNVVSQLQRAFHTIMKMNGDDCIVAAQTLRTLSAMDERYKKHPLILSLANAIREKMVSIVEDPYATLAHQRGSTEKRFCQAWGMLGALPHHSELRWGITELQS